MKQKNHHNVLTHCQLLSSVYLLSMPKCIINDHHERILAKYISLLKSNPQYLPHAQS